MKESIAAVIAVRGGSKRIKDKNISSFGENNLLIHKIKQLKKVKKIDSVIVTSDSKVMLDMAKNEGAIGYKRSERSSADNAPMHIIIEEVCKNISVDHVIFAPCVCPLFDEFDRGIAEYFDNIKKGHDSLIAVIPLKEFFWDTNGKPINYKDRSNPPLSQELEPIYKISNGMYMASRLNMIKWKYWIGENPYMFKIDRKLGIDIDDVYDLKIARLLFQDNLF